MINIERRMRTIQALLQEGSEAALTYAALECRLTIEKVCYERLKISYKYLSYDDLRKWQPRKVVEQVIEDANELAAHGFKLSISRDPVEQGYKESSMKDFESSEYVEIGKQVAVDLVKLGKLWNALSNVALHVKLPENKDEDIRVYGSAQDIKEKVLASLKEFEALKSGTLLASGFATNYFFLCDGCETEIRRVEKLLKDGQVINCVNPSCNETYLIHKKAGDTFYQRRTAPIKCNGCGGTYIIPMKLIDQLCFGDTGDFPCDACGEVNRVRIVARKEEPTTSP